MDECSKIYTIVSASMAVTNDEYFCTYVQWNGGNVRFIFHYKISRINHICWPELDDLNKIYYIVVIA